MSAHQHQMFRPPAEHDSVLIRVADGCPHNACAFCAMYRGVPYRVHEPEDTARAIAQAARAKPLARRVFLADGDALALPTPRLLTILEQLDQHFPALSRVTCYASGRAMAAKSDHDLNALRAAKLRTVYLGLESGCEDILKRMAKNTSAACMIDGAQRMRMAGISVSVMVLLGLGGRAASAAHVRDTALALNAMQPRLLSCLRLVPIPKTPLSAWIQAGRFALLSEAEAARELRDLLAALNLRQTVFRADHVSNILPLAGRLPTDRGRLLEELDELLDARVLDTTGPGRMPNLL